MVIKNNRVFEERIELRFMERVIHPTDFSISTFSISISAVVFSSGQKKEGIRKEKREEYETRDVSRYNHMEYPDYNHKFYCNKYS